MTPRTPRSIDDFFHPCFVVAQGSDGWIVVFSSNVREDEDYLMEVGHKNASRLGADPDTVRIVWNDSATEEELEWYYQFIDLQLYLMRHHMVEVAHSESQGNSPGTSVGRLSIMMPEHWPTRKQVDSE